MTTDDTIWNDVRERIIKDYDFKDNGKWLQKGRCPSCRQKELYVAKERPLVLKCGRADNCGWEQSTRDAYPEFFDVWSKRYKATPAAPHAAADAYVAHGRHLNLLNMAGAYSQETYEDRDRKIVTATVRFALPNNTWWERFIDQPSRFDKKARFKWGGSHSGYAWIPQRLSYDDLARAHEIWIAEGIFDAWALNDKGIAAVSAMSCNNYPHHFLKELLRVINAAELKRRPKLVFAFDIGAAGTEYTRKFVAQAIEDGWKATAAQPRPEGETDKLDWNDLKIRGRLEPEDLKTYLWNGQVLLAENATEKALLLYEKHKWASFPFVHKSVTWWASLNQARIAETMKNMEVSEKVAAKHCAEVAQICNSAFRVLYFQRDEAIDESFYYLRVEKPDQRTPWKNTFTADHISNGQSFKTRLAHIAGGAQWTGSTKQLDLIIAGQTARLKTVETLNFTGYSRKHEAWVIADFAVHQGKVSKLNDQDYFDLGSFQVKLRGSEDFYDITYDPDVFDTSFLPAYWTAFRENGLITLTFWVMSFFAEQIRREFKALGFLEMTGVPGTGKSTVIEFLWKLAGRENYEGFDPAKSTLAGRIRNLAKVANLPVVFMEGDRDDDTPHSKRFDWNEIKPLFNGRIGREQGVRNGGNETYAPPFRGALVIEQNYPVNAAPAIMERLMPLEYTKEGWSETTKAAAREIEAWPFESLSGTIIHLARREADYMAVFRNAVSAYEAKLLAIKVRNGRIRLTHAELHAGLDAMAKVMPDLQADAVAAGHAKIDAMALLKDRSLESDHPIVSDFWEAYAVMSWNEGNETPDPINHSRNNDTIAINIYEFEARCRKASVSLPALDQLKKHLKSSKSAPFLEVKNVNSRAGRIVRCWIFRHPDAVKPAKGN